MVGLYFPYSGSQSLLERNLYRQIVGTTQASLELARTLPAGLGAGGEPVSPAAVVGGAARLPAVRFSFLPPSSFQHARSGPQRHKCGLLRALSQQSSGRPSGGIHRPAEEKCQLWNKECRPHDLSGHWGDVAILHRRFTWAQSWPCSSIGYESSVHRFCIYVAHLGQVHSFVDSAPSICLSSEEEGKKPTYLGPKA